MNHSDFRDKVNRIINHTLNHNMKPWWFITFHYGDNKNNEAEIIKDVKDIKNKLKRIIYQSRDQNIQGVGRYEYPRFLFINEKSRWGSGQYHTHLILERLPTKINTQSSVEYIFKTRLPAKIKSVSKWKRVDVQRISNEHDDLNRISRYLTKQNNLETLSIDVFNSDL